MASTSLSEVRKKYLDFFASHDHAIISSAPLVPENDPTTLFTGSGMQPMVPYLLGQKHPEGTRIANSQTCFRVNDIDDIGDNRHTTFFEMLGNWSLGDYFKEKQIPWMFDFLTQELGLNPEHIYVTIFAGNDAIGIPKDTESAELWAQAFASKNIGTAVVDDAETKGMQGGRIFSYDEKKNWWSRTGVPANMPIGEIGGPDSEMFWDFSAGGGPASGGETPYDFHAHSPYADQPCHVNCDCGRFMEIGNNVFIEYIKTTAGFEKLPQQNVDFGGGLERLTAACANNPDVFAIDVFIPLRETLEKISGKAYATSPETIHAFRVILDHIRAATFLIHDNVVPSNKDQGYFTRRLIRRAVRYANTLGITKPFTVELALSVIHAYSDAYPALADRKEIMLRELTREEEKFQKTLASGLKTFEEKAHSLKRGDNMPAQDVFDLLQSYGFPFEMSEELAKEKGLHINKEDFQVLFAGHQELSRTGAEQKFKGGLADHSDMSVKYHTATHLLHKALKIVLGDHVQQKGSNITPERLRFDFSHPEKMTAEQIQKTEDIINKQIRKDLIITHEEMSLAQAKEKGALGLFEHKYGDTVSVYTVGDFSCEICGGPHVEQTGILGTFKIAKEESASAGIRRIKAVLE